MRNLSQPITLRARSRTTGLRPCLCSLPLFVLLLALTETGYAQGLEPEGLGDSANTGRAAGAIVQPFDRIDVRVKGEPQLSDIYTVTPSGTINFPLIGTVPVSGRRAEEVGVDIEQRLSSYLRRPDVTAELIAVERTGSGIKEPGVASVGAYSVYITGAIEEPGVYYVQESVNALQLIVRAGGLERVEGPQLTGGGSSANNRGAAGGGSLQVIPDLKHVSIVDREGNVDFLDLSLMGQRDLELDPLDPGDTVIVPGHHSGSYAVYGWVARSGAFPLRQPILLTEALAQAIPDRRFSDVTKVKILRGDPRNPEVFTVNVAKLHSQKRVDLLPVIRPGDTIFVPRNFYSKWIDIVDIVRGARSVTSDVDAIRDQWTLRDID